MLNKMLAKNGVYIVSCQTARQAGELHLRFNNYCRDNHLDVVSCRRNPFETILRNPDRKVRFISIHQFDKLRGFHGKIISGYFVEKELDKYDAEKRQTEYYERMLEKF